MACRLINLHLKRSITTYACSRNFSRLDGSMIFPTKHGIQNANKPVIFLLSWTGSRERDLVKYSAIYEERGYTVVRSIVSIKTVLSWQRSSILERDARSLVDMLREHHSTTKPLLIHLFSNGGFFLYDAINTQLRLEVNKDINLTGCILDSAPDKESLTRYLKFIVTITPGPMAYKYAVGIMISSFIRSLFWGRWFLRYALGARNEEARCWQRMSKEPNICPQLFLFSKADKYVNYKYIQMFISERKKMGVKTHCKMWEDSEHVAHYRKYPDAYLTEVLKFLQMCQSQE